MKSYGVLVMLITALPQHGPLLSTLPEPTGTLVGACIEVSFLQEEKSTAKKINTKKLNEILFIVNKLRKIKKKKRKKEMEAASTTKSQI